MEIAAEDTVSRENSKISEDADPRYEHRESSETATEDAVPREITEKTEATENTGISQAILVDPAEETETTEVSKQAVAEEIQVTDTIEVTEVDVDIPEPTLEVPPKEKEENTTTPPGSPQKENPEAQNNSEDNTEVDAEQVAKNTHKYPETSNSLVNKIFSVFRQAKESNPQPATEYGLQM